VLGLVIAAALAALLLVAAVGALRRGDITVGERTYRRGEATFWLLVAGGLLGGGAILATAAHAAITDDRPAASHAIEAAGFRIEVPESWEPIEDEESFPVAANVLVLAGGQSELVVMAPDGATPAPSTPARELADALRDPDIEYARWEAQEAAGGTMVVDAEYLSPRGEVRARHLIAASAGGTRAWTAVCSTHGDVAPCEHAIGTFVLTE
jgi:hypothetical protein